MEVWDYFVACPKSDDTYTQCWPSDAPRTQSQTRAPSWPNLTSVPKPLCAAAPRIWFPSRPVCARDSCQKPKKISGSSTSKCQSVITVSSRSVSSWRRGLCWWGSPAIHELGPRLKRHLLVMVGQWNRPRLAKSGRGSIYPWTVVPSKLGMEREYYSRPYSLG